MAKRNFKTLYHLNGIVATLLFFNAQTIYAQSNWIKRGSDPGKYTMGIDSSIQRDKQSVMTIKIR